MNLKEKTKINQNNKKLEEGKKLNDEEMQKIKTDN